MCFIYVKMSSEKSAVKSTEETIDDAIDGFHKTLFSIMKIARYMEPNNSDLEWMAAKLRMAADMEPLHLISRFKNKIWDCRKQIMEKDKKFFIENSFDSYIKNDENKNFMQSLLNMIKKGIDRLTAQEEAHIWSLAQDLLRYTINYMRAAEP